MVTRVAVRNALGGPRWTLPLHYSEVRGRKSATEIVEFDPGNPPARENSPEDRAAGDPPAGGGTHQPPGSARTPARDKAPRPATTIAASPACGEQHDTMSQYPAIARPLPPGLITLS